MLSHNAENDQMLTSQALARTTHSFRRGYQAGHSQAPRDNLPVPTTAEGVPLRPFSDHDYEEGYRAGLNDFFWSQTPRRTYEERCEFMRSHGVPVATRS